MVYNWPAIIQNWLYPPSCILCGDLTDTGRDLCQGCEGDLSSTTPACPICALPIPHRSPKLPCGRCLRKRPLFERCLAPYRYLPPADELIGGLKFNGRLSHARIMGELLANYVRTQLTPDNYPQALIPVPLHPHRLRERGFNQAVELARPVARRLNIPLRWRLCQRQVPTSPQTGLSAVERRRNLRNAFRVSDLRGIRQVALIDDVITTGATVTELTRTLLRAGAARVEVWAFCRTPEPV